MARAKGLLRGCQVQKGQLETDGAVKIVEEITVSLKDLRFIIRLTEEARAAILDGTFAEYKETFLRNYYPERYQE